MHSFFAAVADFFGKGSPPAARDLIVWDGMDQLDKEEAQRFFQNKKWEDVLTYLQGLRPASAAYFLEEWVVLAPNAISYYARAYIEYLIGTLNSDDPDTEFTANLFAQLYQLAYMYNGHLPFSERQIQLLVAISRASAAIASEGELSSYGEHDIEEQIQKFLQELDPHEG